MKILSLGAGGFIGSHLTHRLLQEGHVVTAVDLETEKVTDCLEHPNLTFFQHDITSVKIFSVSHSATRVRETGASCSYCWRNASHSASI